MMNITMFSTRIRISWLLFLLLSGCFLSVCGAFMPIDPWSLHRTSPCKSQQEQQQQHRQRLMSPRESLSQSRLFFAPCHTTTISRTNGIGRRTSSRLWETIEFLDSIRSDEDPNRIDPAKAPPGYNFYVDDVNEIDLSAYWYKPTEDGWVPPPGFEELNRKLYGVNPMLDDEGNVKSEYLPGPPENIYTEQEQRRSEMMGAPKGRLETLHFTVKPDGTFICEVKGIKGPSCLKLSEEMDSVLGKPISMTLTDEYYEDPIIEEAYVEATELSEEDGDGRSSTAW